MDVEDVLDDMFYEYPITGLMCVKVEVCFGKVHTGRAPVIPPFLPQRFEGEITPINVTDAPHILWKMCNRDWQPSARMGLTLVEVEQDGVHVCLYDLRYASFTMRFPQGTINWLHESAKKTLTHLRIAAREWARIYPLFVSVSDAPPFRRD